MYAQNFLTTIVTLFVLSVSVPAQADWWPFSRDNEDGGLTVTELQWQDLIPDDFVQPENPFLAMSQEQIDKLMDGSEESNAELERLKAAFNYAPTVASLDGLRVKIPAYITPLEFSEQSMLKEFLLVPYVGACIHVPPPPANQIVHAQSPEPLEIPSMYDPVWAIGTIRTETIQSELAESGYRLDVEKIMPYVRN